MNRNMILLFLSIFSTISFHYGKAEIRLPAIVSSNMVLQRNTTIQLWGWADAKEKITINASWIEDGIEIVANKNGEWQTNLLTTNSLEKQSIKLTSKKSAITLENILFGEVWLCSGQSNMQQPVKGYDGQPTFGSIEAIIKSKNSNLRLFTVERKGSKEPLDDFDEYRKWQSASPENVADFSAVAYFFGQQLQEVLEVPVGLIHTSWGGSTVQAWMADDVITKYQEVSLDTVDISKMTNKIPTVLFNAMINPLIPYKIKGALWYQGEANRHEPEKYKELFPAMVKDWRDRWGIGDFPFYFTQIAPFTYGNNAVFQDVKNSAFIREAQLQCLNLIPNSGIAITTDIGDPNFIHPPKKKEVADRLLYYALQQTYGYGTLNGKPAIYDSLTITDNKILLSFKNAELGLFSKDTLTEFEIAGEDKIFYPAKAEIIKRKLIRVSSNQVPSPVAVRYAWKNWVVGTLYNNSLIPVSSFRTDNWDDATRGK